MQLLYCTSMGSHHYEQPNLKWHAENVHSFFTFPFCTCVQLLFCKSLESSRFEVACSSTFVHQLILLIILPLMCILKNTCIVLHLQIYMIWNAIFVWLHIKSEILIFKLSWYTFFYKCCFISALKINLTVWILDLIVAANEGWRYLAFLSKLICG